MMNQLPTRFFVCWGAMSWSLWHEDVLRKGNYSATRIEYRERKHIRAFSPKPWYFRRWTIFLRIWWRSSEKCSWEFCEHLGGTSIRFTLKWFFEEFVSTTGNFNWKSWMFHGVLRSPLRCKEHLRRALAAIEKDQRAGQENSFCWCCVQIFGKLIVSRGW